jgi:hypothetical protein
MSRFKKTRSSLITSFTSPSLVFFRHASFVLSRNSSAIPCLRPALLGKKMPALCSKIGYETASKNIILTAFFDGTGYMQKFLHHRGTEKTQSNHRGYSNS